MQRADRGERIRGAHPGRPAQCGAAEGPGHRVHQHPPRHRRHGDWQLEADGRLPSPPHCRGFQGPGQPADTAHGSSTEESQIGCKYALYLSNFSLLSFCRGQKIENIDSSFGFSRLLKFLILLIHGR